ncbi:MAG: AbrB/MazE/SpoVT family DNA-binding domain-containing protein [Candidatus Hinthialibacter antarcticus]|nr:AbrB/MazE/SpoVT family DNA-binding domain-containing protein [Candidatus Hinthialibacter antarcticus]
MKATVAERGQVTIPKEIRDQLGITHRTVLEFREERGRMIVEKVSETDPVSEVTGCLKLKKSTDELVDDLRGKA